MRHLGYTVIAVTLIILLLTACQEPQLSATAESNEPFDAPIRRETVDLGPSPYYPDGKSLRPTALSCYYFPDFMVKEYYLGGRGAEWLSILPTPQETPECKGSHEPGERIIEYPWGYFMGVKGHLVFFDGSDSINGGWPFAVYDSETREPIFEDSAYYERGSSTSLVEVASTSTGYLLKYLRVVLTDCNLNSEGAACWNRIKAEYSLSDDMPPVCTDYEHIAQLVGHDQVESMIAYAVEVTLSPGPAMRSVAGPTRCWPSH